MIESQPLNLALRDKIAVDFAARNAWVLGLDEEGDVVWVSGEERLHHPPAESVFQQLEDWFIGLLPIDSQM